MKAIGIDLGTTNSVAAIGGKDLRILPAPGGENLVPSAISFVRRRKSKDGDGEIVVGRQALNNAARDPENTILSIKRLMGRVYGEPRVDEVRKKYGFHLAEPPKEDDPDQAVRVLLNGEGYSPEDLSAMILGKVKSNAELALGESVTHAVITVPAYFEERQRRATQKAGELAGLQVIRIVDEPTAAALAFGLGREEERNRVLVFDLGGGTFDISIIQMTRGEYAVLETTGDNWLGGDDFDRQIVKRMSNWVQEEYGIDLSKDLAFLTKAGVEAQRAKVALSDQNVVEILMPMFLKSMADGPIDIEMEITREQFESDIRPLVARTIDLVNEAMASQSLSPDDITQVLMVGGSTAVPLVQEEIGKVFGREKIKRNVNPMECVALGAAILASEAKLEEGATSEEGSGTRLHQVTAMALGIAALKGDNPDAFVPIIPKGTPYPLSEPKKRTFYPTSENFIRVQVYEGNAELASLNEQQGIVEFPLPEGVPLSTPVEVIFNYDHNRVLTVAVQVVGTGHFIEEKLQRDRPRVHVGSGTLVDDWQEDLQGALQAAQHFQESYGRYISEEEDASELEQAIIEAKAALENDDRVLGARVTLVLRNKLFGSGTASQLFMAERSMAMGGTTPEMTKKLAQATTALRRAHDERNEPKVEELSMALKLAVAQIMARQRSVRDVEDAAVPEGVLEERSNG